MKNILSEKPTTDLHGRLKFSVGYVSKIDITGKKILDIGCGFGWFEMSILSRKPKSITATEITKIDLQSINANLRNRRLKTAVADATALPFSSNYFDTVVSWEVLEHVEKGFDIVMFQEVSRVLKKGGVFYLSTPFNSLPSRLFDPAWYLLGHRHYSVTTIKNMAKYSGFIISDLQIKGGFWDILQSLDLYFSKWILRRKTIGLNKLNELVDQEYKFQGLNEVFVKLKKI